MKYVLRLTIPVLFLLALSENIAAQESSFVKLNPDGTLAYTADSRGNIIPDFSAVGYRRSDVDLPDVPIVKTVSPVVGESSQQVIQAAIDEVSKKSLVNGFRGTILFKKGTYNIPGTIYVRASGIVLRGEGDDLADGTKWVATGKGQRTLLEISGSGSRSETTATRVKITDDFVPVGAFSFNVSSTSGYKVGDNILLTRPGTHAWIQDLKMDKIEGAKESEQWTPNRYNLYYERAITKIEGNRIYIDNPIVMEMESKYGGGYISKYSFAGRISDVGVESICFESEYAYNTDEDHGWVAVKFSAIENAWARNITSRYFGYACVHLSGSTKYVTVKDSKCLDAKSKIRGGRRYSFNIAGRAQLNLVTGCYTTEGRHDYVTGGRTAGPNVFHNCTAVNAHNDIGPHQRWATGTLYDNVKTDSTINVQERRSGGHGWTGVTQVLWNCTASKTSVQSPWVSGKNYAIAVKGEKYPGRYYSDRPDGEWELHNQAVVPQSLYEAQLNARRVKIRLQNTD